MNILYSCAMTALILALSSPAFAESRMAGSQARHDLIEKKTEQNAATVEKTAKSKEDAEIEKSPSFENAHPVSLPKDILKMEYTGLYPSGAPESLGIDLWEGANRGLVTAAMNALPAQMPYRILQTLSLRALLTEADSSLMMETPSTRTETNLLTVRLEKMLEMGAFKEAASLYAKSSGNDSDAQLTKTGVMALLADRRIALACLETKASHDRFEEAPFWTKMNLFCDYFLEIPIQAETLDKLGDEGKLLGQIIKDRSYTYALKDPEAFRDLNFEDQLFLFSADRIRYGEFSEPSLKTATPRLLQFMLNDPAFPDSIRMPLYVQALSTGLIPLNVLTEFYKTSKASDGTLSDFFQKASKASIGQEQAQILGSALTAPNPYGLPALWPFHNMLAETSPEHIAKNARSTAFLILCANANLTPVPQEWINYLAKNESLQQGSLEKTLLEALLSENEIFFKSENSNIPAAEIQEPSPEENLIPTENKGFFNIVLKKLDKDDVFHNYTGENAYDKRSGLTINGSYVMPLEDLENRLIEAQKNQRLGEVILLSSVMLRQAHPEEKQMMMFDRVLHSLHSVGLTKEARQLAIEALIGQINKGEN